ncbi:MAG: TetR/AcrR family transcriptional regulator [Lachnospiraceae bacterium]
MSIKERRNLEKAEMKRKIMDAAIEIINQDGYENLSIRKIAVKIEYSPTTIYLYYKDKAQIITDMSNELYSRIVKDVTDFTNENTLLSIDKQVKEALLVFIRSLSGKPEMAKAVMYSGKNVIFANENTVPTNLGIEMLNKMLSTGIEQKTFRSNAANTSWMITSALLGFVMSVVENQIYLSENFNQVADDFVEILMGGIMRNEKDS